MKIKTIIEVTLSFLMLLQACLANPEKGTLNEFYSIKKVNQKLILIFNKNGGRFNYQINNGERKISNYGESIEIPITQNSEFVTKGLKIMISPASDQPESFLIEKVIDLRPMGGNLRKEAFSLFFDSGMAVFGVKTITDCQ
jgi:hypothetical protein